jgi:hypothetical protein
MVVRTRHLNSYLGGTRQHHVSYVLWMLYYFRIASFFGTVLLIWLIFVILVDRDDHIHKFSDTRLHFTIFLTE